MKYSEERTIVKEDGCDMWNHLAACKSAFDKKEVFQYLEGTGEWQEPPSFYEDCPETNVNCRASCINDLYKQTGDGKIIETFKTELLHLAEGTPEQLKFAVRYLGAQSYLAGKGLNSFQLKEDKDFWNTFSKIVTEKYKQEQSGNLSEYIAYWAERLQSLSGKSFLIE